MAEYEFGTTNRPRFELDEPISQQLAVVAIVHAGAMLVVGLALLLIPGEIGEFISQNIGDAPNARFASAGFITMAIGSWQLTTLRVRHSSSLLLLHCWWTSVLFVCLTLSFVHDAANRTAVNLIVALILGFFDVVWIRYKIKYDNQLVRDLEEKIVKSTLQPDSTF